RRLGQPGALTGSPVGGGVEQATLGPQGVGPALQAERRVGPDRALVDLAVVADLADDVDGEVGLEAEAGVERRGVALAVLARDRLAEEPQDVEVVAAAHLLDVLAGDAELLGLDR